MAPTPCSSSCSLLDTDSYHSSQSPPSSLTKDKVDALPNGPYPIQDYLDHNNPSEAFYAGHGDDKKPLERCEVMESRLTNMLACFNNTDHTPEPTKQT